MSHNEQNGVATATPVTAEDDASSWQVQELPGEKTYPTPLTSCVSFCSDEEGVLLHASRHGAKKSSSASRDRADPATSSLSADVTLEKAGARRLLHFNPTSVVAGIVTCGGLCPGINNVIRSIVNTLHYRYKVKRVIGFRFGFEGLVKEKSSIIDLTPDRVKDVHQFGGSLLGSSRGPQDPAKMVDYLVALGVSMLFTIGGDGTQRGAQAIANEITRRGLNIAVVGIPKTIDNDVSFVEKTFGFETAVEKAQASLMAAHEEARSARNGIGIVKLMGRESGFIALNAALASGDVNILLLPEFSFTIDRLISLILERFKTRSHVLIVVAEGAGQNLTGGGKLKDVSGNPIFSDIAIYLKDEIGKQLKAAHVEHTIKLIDPSYSIRSAPANASDAIFALTLGQMAAHAAMAGKTNMIVGALHNEFVHLPISRAVAFRKKVDVTSLTFQAFLDASGQPTSLL
ncbi:6-phosphofructokinase [Zopfochytrium polystomum]|nr:6-phosphofructokinase [Zopfochytrium polystomum]